jgi:plasmid stabilization system protein ParE
VKPVVFHAAARAELDAAMEFYERRALGLGLSLMTKVEDASLRIAETPHAWPPYGHSGLRKYFTDRFPFIIFYMELPDRIWIAAVAHASRRPGYWKHRRPELS